MRPMTDRILLVRPSGEQGRHYYHRADENGEPVCGTALQIYDDWMDIDPDHALADQLEICGKCDPDNDTDRRELARNGSTLSQKLEDQWSPEDVGLSPLQPDEQRASALGYDARRNGGVSR